MGESYGSMTELVSYHCVKRPRHVARRGCHGFLCEITSKWLSATSGLMKETLVTLSQDRRCQHDWIKRYLIHPFHVEVTHIHDSSISSLRASSGSLVRLLIILAPGFGHICGCMQAQAQWIAPWTPPCSITATASSSRVIDLANANQPQLLYTQTQPYSIITIKQPGSYVAIQTCRGCQHQSQIFRCDWRLFTLLENVCSGQLPFLVLMDTCFLSHKHC